MTRKTYLLLLVVGCLFAILQSPLQVKADEVESSRVNLTASEGEVQGTLDNQLLARARWRVRRENRLANQQYRSPVRIPGLPTVQEPVEQPQDPAEISSSDQAAAETTGEPSTAVTPEEFEQLRLSVRRTLDAYYPKTVNVADRSPWSVMHTLIAYGVDTEIYANGKKVNAIGWLCWNQPCYGQRIFYLRDGKLKTRQGVGVEGHEGQFLSMLAQSRVKADYPMKVDGKNLTVMDLVRHEQASCRAGTELTFKLIGLAHYLPSDAEWKNDLGESWSIQRLIQEELKQSVIGSACGGTHRLMGFSYAVKKREQREEPMTGQWSRAQQYIQDFHQYTFRLQNENGTFSANWFEGRGDWGDIERRMDTTGHTLEWLAYSLDTQQLKERRVAKAAAYLSKLLYENRGRDWEIGPRGHALHALAIYNQRVFGAGPGYRPSTTLAGEISSASQD